MAKILVIDDDIAMTTLIKRILEKQNHLIYVKNELDEIRPAEYQSYNLILLDIMMPKINGYEICRKIIQYVECPIIFLTAKAEEEDKVRGFEAGADDYITKPFYIKEFIARIEAHLRRERKLKKVNQFTHMGITFDFALREIYIEGNKIPLTSNEFKICEILFKNRGQIMTKDMIYEKVYDEESDTQYRTITEYVYSIRKKFRKYGCEPILTLWGVGYRWRDE